MLLVGSAMIKYETFGDFWQEYFDRSVDDRARYFTSLSKPERTELIESFFDDGWDQLIAQNVIDERLDLIKKVFDIDLLDMRIQIIKNNKSFLIQKVVWNIIEEYIMEFKDFYDANIILGGLLISDHNDESVYCIQKQEEK